MGLYRSHSAYDGRNLLMVASEARKARGQQGRAELWMGSFSSSDMELYIWQALKFYRCLLNSQNLAGQSEYGTAQLQLIGYS